ncbi:hypothetical protein HCC61_09525 [Streptomyces sp. HNM0575]|uniref:hypothetical protein n=1 Tax=Streptomyces sp. HNM0575 TaxID=2716338 RepID=UPI00145F58A6|nr:hypothetical protein [Streptomyces sp. HNM0575]NLU72912.1 hypothetical protein [Streptomyces sp. HNM0575]
MKTDEGVGENSPHRKVKGGTGTGAVTTDARWSLRKRIGFSVLGVAVALYGLFLVGKGYEDGPRKVADGTPGTVTIEYCSAHDRGRHTDVECSGAFHSEDGKLRYDVKEFDPGTHYDEGEKVGAVALSPESFDRSIPALYAEAARSWCFAAAAFGVAMMLIESVVRAGRRPSADQRLARYTFLGGLGLLVGGVLGGFLSLVADWAVT